MEGYAVFSEETTIIVEKEQKKLRQEIARQYVDCRKRKKLTQADVAAAAGMKRPGITRFETGRYNPTVDMLVRLAESMGMSVEIRLVEKAAAEEKQVQNS